MKAFLLSFTLAAALLSAQAQVRLRISIKQILDPSGNLPTTGILTNQAAAAAAIAEGNGYLALAGFGHRLQMIDYQTVPSVSVIVGTTPTPTWNLPPTPQNVGLIEDYALANPYGWRADAVNVYITQGAGATIGYCSFPGDNRSTIMLASRDGNRTAGQLLLHEVGHFYNLGHTFNGSTCCDRTLNPTCSHMFGATGPGAPGVLADLIPDLICEYPDEVSTNRFGVGRTPETLNASEFALFSTTYSNLMSYHAETILLSEIQKDVVAISANTTRANTAAGRTHFVSKFGFTWGVGGDTAASLPSVASGIAAANSGEVVRIYSGSYNEPQTITKAVTLGASRGPVTIGQP